MARVKVTALDSFLLGRRDTKRGDTFTVGKGEADDLEKAGLVTIDGGADDEAIDDLVGDGAKKMPITSNKMEPKPDNKSAKK